MENEQRKKRSDMQIIQIQGFRVERRRALIYRRGSIVVIAIYRGRNSLLQKTFWDIYVINEVSKTLVDVEIDLEFSNEEEFKNTIQKALSNSFV